MHKWQDKVFFSAPLAFSSSTHSSTMDQGKVINIGKNETPLLIRPRVVCKVVNNKKNEKYYYVC